MSELDFYRVLTVIEQGVYVVESKGSERIPPGAEILSINGLTSRKMLKTIYSSVSSDGGNQNRHAAGSGLFGAVGRRS